MKILHCTAQLPMKTGSGVYFSALVEGLMKKGHQNSVLYGTQQPFSETSLSETLNGTCEILEYPVKFLTSELFFPIAGMSDIMPYQATVYSKMSEEMYNVWIKNFKEKLIKAAKDFSPEVVIVHHIFILASLVQEIFPQTKIIAICHGTDIRQIKQHSWIKKKYIKNINKIKTFLAVSPKNVEDISSIFSVPEENITVIGGGFNPEIFNYKERIPFKNRANKQIQIVYAGKISPTKGVFELAKTLPIILKKHPNTILTLIGNATEEQKKQLWTNTKKSDNIKICNAKTQTEISKTLKKADIFVLPSYYETLGLIAIEALACGLRVVTSEIDGLIALLEGKIKESGIIEFVKLPKIYSVDKPIEEDIPAYVARLAEKILLQIERIQKENDAYPLVSVEIKSHSWDSIISNIENIIKK